jgi:uncharacterized cysteine cluster protein YcgN (CxxCxxCC family)
MPLPAEKPTPDPADELPFWRRKAMKDMTQAEWESLCDGCGRCCLNKLQEEGSDRTYYTDVGCKLLDGQSCRCTDYANRSAKVKDCVTLTSRNINRISWLPPTCGYVLVARGKDLPWWHPLVSGDPDTVHTAGVSVRGVVATPAAVPGILRPRLQARARAGAGVAAIDRGIEQLGQRRPDRLHLRPVSFGFRGFA